MFNIHVMNVNNFQNILSLKYDMLIFLNAVVVIWNWTKLANLGVHTLTLI